MGVGEQMERARRRRFWITLGALAATGMPLGFVIGWNAGHNSVGVVDAVSQIPPIGLALAAAIYVLSMTVGTWVFAKSIDEVEMADNLWGSAAGFYAYTLLFPAWWLLGRANYVPAPDDWMIFIVASLSALIVYAWRKWRAR